MITYSTAFKMKNETVNIIEKYEGLSKNGSVKIINQYLSNSGYNGEGRCECESDWGCYGAKNLSDSSSSLVKINNNNIKEDYFYCVQYHSKGENSGYYDIQLFLKFDLPVLGKIGNFKVKGQTIKMKYPANWSDTQWPGVSN